MESMSKKLEVGSVMSPNFMPTTASPRFAAFNFLRGCRWAQPKHPEADLLSSSGSATRGEPRRI